MVEIPLSLRFEFGVEMRQFNGHRLHYSSKDPIVIRIDWVDFHHLGHDIVILSAYLTTTL